MNTTKPDDTAFMRRALQLAARGRGRVEPNPMVGCVIVRGGKVIAEGYHHRFGGPHAEVEALRRCSGEAKRATVYVNLEPCCYYGKTPPCTEALIATGVNRVVAAIRDPNPRVAGRGIRILRKAGIAITEGILQNEAADLNAPFIKLMHHKRPWVILKWAQSLDGKIATHRGDSKWITDEVMRAHAHRVRGRMDAIIVGQHTAHIDDPQLTCRVGRPKRIATRIVIDPHLRTSSSAKLVRTACETPTWLFCDKRVTDKKANRLESHGCVVQRVASKAQTGLSLTAILDILGKHQMTNVLVEGGGKLLGYFFDQKLADEVQVYIAPRLIGGEKAVGALNARGVDTIQNSIHLPGDTRLKPLGAGWHLQARL